MPKNERDFKTGKVNFVNPVCFVIHKIKQCDEFFKNTLQSLTLEEKNDIICKLILLWLIVSLPHNFDYVVRLKKHNFDYVVRLKKHNFDYVYSGDIIKMCN